MNIYANIRNDKTRFYLGKQDFGYIYGDEEKGIAVFSSNRKELKRKHPDIVPTHSMIVQNGKAPKILAAFPFMLTKHNMDNTFKLAEDM